MIILGIFCLSLSEFIALCTIIGTAITWLITKWLERRKQLADEKERRYAKLLGEIHYFSKDTFGKPNANKWIHKHKELWLFADDKVLIAITNFFDNYGNSLADDYKKQIAYNMRKDLYKSRYTLIERLWKKIIRLFICKYDKLNKDHFRDINIS